VELQDAVLFAEIPHDIIAQVVSLARVVDFGRDETIFNEGDPALDIYILRDGKVELTYTLPQDSTTEIRISSVCPGQTFAWSALVGGGTLSAHARALEPSSAFLLPAAELHAIFLEHPIEGYEVMRRLAQQILQRLRDTRRELRWLHQGAR